MRFSLILIAFVGFVAVCWHAVFKGTDTQFLRGAPQIAAQVMADTQAAIRETSATDIVITVDGRNVHLGGKVPSDTDLGMVTSAASGVALTAALTHDISIDVARADTAQTAPDTENSETPEIAAPSENTETPVTGVAPAVSDQSVGDADRKTEYFVIAWKEPDGTVFLNGKVPDASTRTALIAAAQELTDLPLIEQLKTGEGFPSTVWLDLNKRGFEALGIMENGELSVLDSAVKLRGSVDSMTEYDELTALASTDWTLEVDVENFEPDAEATLLMAADGSITGSGLLPEGLTPTQMAAMLPGLSAEGFEADGHGRAVDWSLPMEGLNIVLPRLEDAQIRLKHRQFFLSGTLKDGYSVDGLEASLRSAMTDGWDLAIDVSAPPPESELLLSKADGIVGLSGVLPRGLTPDQALALFGDSAGASGLTEGGDGDAQNWRGALTRAAETLELFADATGEVSGDRIAMSGTLKPGYDGESIRAWQSARTATGTWEIEIDADTTAPQDGDIRRVLSETGGEAEERFSNGFWLPVVAFAPSVDTCATETETLLTSDKVRFITSSARVVQGGKAILDRLAAVLQRCADLDNVVLEIGGHTDSVGNDAANMRLSEKRAQVVLDELAKRGVRADAMVAVGYGENEPIASNNTSDGRAQNRRITFSWSKKGG